MHYYKNLLKRGRDYIGSYLGAESPRGKVTVTLANWLTLIRLVIVPIFWYAFFSGELWLEITASVLFIIGAITDLWDGKIARSRGEETEFGNFADPLVDKLLVLSAFWAILIREDFQAYFTIALTLLILISIRETGLTVMRIVAVSGGSSLVTSMWGKWKTGVQLTTLIFTLVALNTREILIDNNLGWAFLSSGYFYLLISILFALSMITSVTSGLLYVIGSLKSGK